MYVCLFVCSFVRLFSFRSVPTGSHSHGGDVAVSVSHKPTELTHTFFFSSSFVLVFVSVYMALSTVFHSISSPDNSPFSNSVLPVLFLPYWSFFNYISFMEVSLSPDMILCG